MWGVELAVMACMVAVNGVLAAYELALAGVGLARLTALEAEGKTGAASAAYMKRHIEGSLAGIQLGITLVGAVAAATGGAGAEEQLAPMLKDRFEISAGFSEFLAIAAVVAPLTLVTIVFGELVPKVFALRNAERVCLAMSPWMRQFVWVVSPIVFVLKAVVSRFAAWGESRLKKRDGVQGPTVAAELLELRAGAQLLRTARLIGAHQERIIVGAAELTTRKLREILISREMMVTLEADAKVGDALLVAHREMHTRFPVTEGDGARVVGYVNFKDLVAHLRFSAHGSTIRKVVRPIPTLSADDSVPAALERLIREHGHIALVKDADGRVAGMITLEDLIEELVGDIEDEYDSLSTHVVPAGPGWVVGGGLTLTALKDAIGLALPPLDPPAATVAEWLHRSTSPLRPGSAAVTAGFRVVVRKVRRNKVAEAGIEPIPHLPDTMTPGPLPEN